MLNIHIEYLPSLFDFILQPAGLVDRNNGLSFVTKRFTGETAVCHVMKHLPLLVQSLCPGYSKLTYGLILKVEYQQVVDWS